MSPIYLFRVLIVSILVSEVLLFSGCGTVSEKKSADVPAEPVKMITPTAPPEIISSPIEPAPAKPVVELVSPEESDKTLEQTPVEAKTAPVISPESSIKEALIEKKKLSDSKPGTKLPVKKDTNRFIVSVVEKTQLHPAYGKGHRLGLAVDEVQGKTIVLKRGEAYEFDVQTDPLHDVYFSTNPQGWGASAVIDGIKGQFTYRGIITVMPNERTPDVMYYQCRNHNSMGGKVHVVNKAVSPEQLDKLLADRGGTSQPVETANALGGTGDMPMDKAKQKIMLAEMILRSKVPKEGSGNNEQVKLLLSSADSKLQSARKALDAGHKAQAVILADEALKLISNTSQAIPNEDAIKVRRARYNELSESIQNFQDSHKQTYDRTLKKRGGASAVDFDKAKVTALVKDARALADKGEYDQASGLLGKAERIVTEAIHAMLDSQTIVYDLKFETPADEYEYELRRYKSYEELIPVAISENKPADSVVKLMDGYAEKGREQKLDAQKKAKEGNYPDAISLLLSATEDVRRALRLAGVSQ